MRAVNLLPRQHVEQKTERRNPVALGAGIGGAVVLLVLVAGFLLAVRSVDRQRQSLTSARAVLAATPAHHVSAETNAFRSSVLSQREERSLALASAIGKRVSWDRILRRLALVLPDDVWLNKVSGSVPLEAGVPLTSTTSTAFPAAPTALDIEGSTYSQAAVARLLERLQVLPDLKNVQLAKSQSGLMGSRTIINFKILADIQKGKGAS